MPRPLRNLTGQRFGSTARAHSACATAATFLRIKAEAVLLVRSVNPREPGALEGVREKLRQRRGA